MASKEQVKKLIKTIKNEHMLTQAEISTRIGYEEKTLTQLLSKGEKLDHAYNSLQLLLAGLKKSTNEDPYLRLLEENDRFFKTQYHGILSSLSRLIEIGRRSEELIKLNLEHIGTVEALQQGIDPDVVHEQINIQIAEMKLSDETGNDVDK